MASADNLETLRLRPHHIFCNRFLPLDDLIRGEEFARAVNEIKELTQSESDLTVIVTEGPDQLCNYCPDYRNNRCESPIGNEEKVRRWDAKIIKGLGISYGDKITVKDLLALIREKAPLDFCQTRCPWKTFCRVGGERRDLVEGDGRI
jgi:hypothetical protein